VSSHLFNLKVKKQKEAAGTGQAINLPDFGFAAEQISKYDKRLGNATDSSGSAFLSYHRATKTKQKIAR
jgi:hypothetical protein